MRNVAVVHSYHSLLTVAYLERLGFSGSLLVRVFVCSLANWGVSNSIANMGPTRNVANDSRKEEAPLLPGLPDDVALLCLARVPRTYHANLKCVSKRWRELVCGEELRNFRKKNNLEETWIYALCQDGLWGIPKYCCYVLDPYASRRSWKRIQDLPPCIVQRQSMRLEVLGQKAYLIGGRDFTESEWSDDDSDDGNMPNIRDEVYCYDAITNSWSRAAPLSTPRCHFASEVLDGKIYAIGSAEYNPNGRHTWEVYDPITNTWTAQSDPHVMDHSVESIVFNGKLYVRDATYANFELSSACGVVYDPSTGIWHDADNDLLLGWHGTSVVADGRLYAFDLFPDYKLGMWEEEKKKWMPVVRLFSYLDVQCGPPTRYHLVAIGKSIFFIGQGLFTTELDVTNVGKEGGVLSISDVTGPISEIRPMICKCMTI